MYFAGGAGEVEGAGSHWEVLAQGFGVAVDVEDAYWPEGGLALLEEVFAAEVEEGDVVAHGGLDVGDEGEDM